MRKLIFTRRKTFIACLGKLKVYMCDATSNEIVINNYNCRLLGVVKNGETVTFEIPNEEIRLFGIWGKMSKNYCNGTTVIPAGNDDVILGGIATYNPITGNPFQFDK